jgi:hypothetical protein
LREKFEKKGQNRRRDSLEQRTREAWFIDGSTLSLSPSFSS